MDERKIITNTEEENRAVNPQDKSPEEAPASKEASQTDSSAQSGTPGESDNRKSR